MPADLVNAAVLLGNYVIVPGLAYAAQLALGALGITLVFAYCVSPISPMAT